MFAGHPDLERAASALASRLPEPLAVLARLAYNFRWSWTPGGPELFASLDPVRWERCGESPIRLLQEVDVDALRRAADDEDFLARAAAVDAVVRAELERPAAAADPASLERPIAFFCAEYGVHASLPVYAGGLGALAGDILKEASDRALPLVGVGLLYRQGYFRQRIDGWGWQHEYWVDTDPERQPAALVRGAAGEPLTVTVPVAARTVTAQIWRVDVGRVPLYLLDAERRENDAPARWITSRLYIPDPDLRLAQYVLLGVGGLRALEAMGIEPGVVHLNEGHAAFVSLEAARVAAGGAVGALDGALEAARRRTVFTTHTPVPAGNDAYPAEQVASTLSGLAVDLGVAPETIVRLGRTTPHEHAEPFGVTQFALRTSRAANGVSRRHGEVAREMWRGLWTERSVDDVPIAHVTNGVHIASWLGRPMRELLDRHLGDGWLQRATDPQTWAPVDAIPARDLWAARRAQREALVAYVRERAVAIRLGRDEPIAFAQAAASFDPDMLTIGFARRLATYKRLHLLLADAERARRLVGSDRPVQVVLAGKAHPRDDEGKRLVQGVFAHKLEPGFASRVVYLDDYDLRMASRLVRGCDLWVNLPRPPLEASGTSGMKSAMNGGLNLSVLDGWWAEAYDGTNGWAISGETDADHGAQDARHGAELLHLLEAEVRPGFYARDADGVPPAWIERMRASLRTIGPAFGAGRMLEDYQRRIYAA